MKLDPTYRLGEPLDAEDAFGLTLPVLCADMFGVAEAETRPDDGEFDEAISTYDDRS
jgi:hypothetical protein